jgi:hypothetical protein
MPLLRLIMKTIDEDKELSYNPARFGRKEVSLIIDDGIITHEESERRLLCSHDPNPSL